MVRNVVRVAVIALAASLWVIGSASRVVLAQTITFGPNGVQVGPDSPPNVSPDHRRDDDYRRHDDEDRRDRDHDDHWGEVRDQMMGYRDACRDGDRRACVRLGIIIGQNQGRRGQWRQDHPDYFWWDRD